uniref:Putative reverse transcriptase, RNA-dependent DNA polymerase, Gag-polypeptide of LTR copia-type n=1 Tax=Tanacetum cinerariifolium TaxID=118510 RepID=A0A6L2JFI4_TANCI|nr:putative reverse transcriptase, RNA-dependent DNA polymerase, Gag-polypeptide of LTR copia-type [Tanacetum cinerariifolium]
MIRVVLLLRPIWQDLRKGRVLETCSKIGGLYLFDKKYNISVVSNNRSLNLTNVDHDSPCEVCHKAKQTRDSFPLSENKSTIFGKLIHLDVWGPYKVVCRKGFRPYDDEEGPSGRYGGVYQPDLDDILGDNSESDGSVGKTDHVPIFQNDLNALGMEQGFLSQKGCRVKRGVKKKQVSLSNKSVEVNKHVNVALGINFDTQTPNVVNAGLESFLTVYEAHGIHSPVSANKENMNDVGTTVGPISAGDTPVECIRVISEQVANTSYGFFLGKRVAYLLLITMLGTLENVESSSTSTTLIVEKINKIDKIERLIIDGNVTLVNDEANPLPKVDSLCDHNSEDEVASVDNEMANFLASKKVGYGTNSLLEQWKETYENDDYDFDPYDDDMYKDHDIPDKIQSICDNLYIKVRETLYQKKDPNWINALNDEMHALYKNDTWCLTDLPTGRKTIGSKLVFRIRYKSDGEIDRFKVRLVAKGFGQKERIEYEETFSLVHMYSPIKSHFDIALILSKYLKLAHGSGDQFLDIVFLLMVVWFHGRSRSKLPVSLTFSEAGVLHVNWTRLGHCYDATYLGLKYTFTKMTCVSDEDLDIYSRLNQVRDCCFILGFISSGCLHQWSSTLADKIDKGFQYGLIKRDIVKRVPTSSHKVLLMQSRAMKLSKQFQLAYDKCKKMKLSQDMQLIQKLLDDQKRNIVTNSRVTPSWKEIVSLTFSEAGVLNVNWTRLEYCVEKVASGLIKTVKVESEENVASGKHLEEKHVTWARFEKKINKNTTFQTDDSHPDAFTKCA